MNICVAGWYFHEPLLKILAGSGYPCFVVKHRSGVNREGMDYRFEIPEPIGFSETYNVGLEFGCYDWYLKNKWDWNRHTLFTHDDNMFTDDALLTISEITADQAFLFESEESKKFNAGAHGRAFCCSGRFLQRLKDDGGFWYDEGNSGFAPTTTELPDYHNNCIQMFVKYLGSLPEDWSVGLACVIPGLKTGYRGEVRRG